MVWFSCADFVNFGWFILNNRNNRKERTTVIILVPRKKIDKYIGKIANKSITIKTRDVFPRPIN
jgi:hypothetical protein